MSTFGERAQLFSKRLHIISESLGGAGGALLTLAARAEPALRLLLSGRPESIEQVTTLTGLDATTLAETLISRRVSGAGRRCGLLGRAVA